MFLLFNWSKNTIYYRLIKYLFKINWPKLNRSKCRLNYCIQSINFTKYLIIKIIKLLYFYLFKINYWKAYIPNKKFFIKSNIFILNTWIWRSRCDKVYWSPYSLKLKKIVLSMSFYCSIFDGKKKIFLNKIRLDHIWPKSHSKINFFF